MPQNSSIEPRNNLIIAQNFNTTGFIFLFLFLFLLEIYVLPLSWNRLILDRELGTREVHTDVIVCCVGPHFS